MLAACPLSRYLHEGVIGSVLCDALGRLAFNKKSRTEAEWGFWLRHTCGQTADGTGIVGHRFILCRDCSGYRDRHVVDPANPSLKDLYFIRCKLHLIKVG